MYGLLLFIFVVNTFFLMIAILMQSDKSSGLSSTFGGVSGAASSTFGTRETVSFLHKLTIVLTTSFFVLAIVIGLMSKAEFGGNNNVEQSVILQKNSEMPVSGLQPLDQKLDLPVQEETVPVGSEETTVPVTEPEPAEAGTTEE
ncbi:MAG: preprotein translocase subunit SecG [Candidatus Delongbacteria bacterium]|nr:preprotein translocase subunit SecG [Candidatus Delongbacteria bacterium]